MTPSIEDLIQRVEKAEAERDDLSGLNATLSICNDKLVKERDAIQAELSRVREALEQIASGTFDGDLALAASGRWDQVVVALQDIARAALSGEP